MKTRQLIALALTAVLASQGLFMSTAHAGEGKTSIGKGVKCYWAPTSTPSGTVYVQRCAKGI